MIERIDFDNYAILDRNRLEFIQLISTNIYEIIMVNNIEIIEFFSDSIDSFIRYYNRNDNFALEVNNSIVRQVININDYDADYIGYILTKIKRNDIVSFCRYVFENEQLNKWSYETKYYSIREV